MRNFEVLEDYYLGRDPQLKETLAANSLRLIGIDGHSFVVRGELIERLKELKEYLDDKDAELARGLQNVIDDLSSEVGSRKSADNALSTRIDNETLARQNADGTLQTNINNVSGRVTTLETWKNSNNFVMLEDLTTALLNYYTKSQVDALIAAIPTRTYEVVAQLPTTNISTRIIYMVHPQGAEEPDYYNEYLYTGDPSQTYDPNKWELIGNTRVDLTNYYTKTEADALLAAKQDALTAGSNISILSNVIGVTGDTIKEITETELSLIYGWADKNNPGIYRFTKNCTVRFKPGDDGTFTVEKNSIMLWIPYSRTPVGITMYYWEYYIFAGDYAAHIGRIGMESSSGTHYRLQDTRGLVTALSQYSSDSEYPSAKLLYDQLAERDATIEELQEKLDATYDQIPTATATGEFINVQDSSNLPLKDFALGGNASQDGTPTPDNPQDIHVVTGDNTVKVLGKQFFQNEFIGTPTKVANAILPQGTYTLATCDNANFGKQVYFSLFTMGGTQITESGHFTTKDVNFSGSPNYYYYAGESRSSITFTIDDDYQVGIGLLQSDSTRQVMLVAGSEAVRTYEPYTEQTQLLSLGDIELVKIGTYQDRIYKSGGKWYLYKEVGKYNDWDNLYSTTAKTVTNLFQFRMPTATTYGLRSQAMCNCFENIISNNDEEHFFIGTGEANVYHGLNIFINKTRASDSELAIAWLKNNDTIVYYILVTPTTTEITDTTLIGQLENILQMHTNKNVTNAWIEPTGDNAQGGLTLTYRQDIGTIAGANYESRIQALESDYNTLSENYTLLEARVTALEESEE